MKKLIALILLLPAYAAAHDPCAPDIFDADLRQCVTPPPPPVDSDGDGIPDSQDLCPNEGDQGHGIDADGCPLPPPPPPPPPSGEPIPPRPWIGGAFAPMPPDAQACGVQLQSATNADAGFEWNGTIYNSQTDNACGGWCLPHFIGRPFEPDTAFERYSMIVTDGFLADYRQHAAPELGVPGNMIYLSHSDKYWLWGDDGLQSGDVIILKGDRIVFRDNTGLACDLVQVDPSSTNVDVCGVCVQ